MYFEFYLVFSFVSFLFIEPFKMPMFQVSSPYATGPETVNVIDVWVCGQDCLYGFESFVYDLFEMTSSQLTAVVFGAPKYCSIWPSGFDGSESICIFPRRISPTLMAHLANWRFEVRRDKLVANYPRERQPSLLAERAQTFLVSVIFQRPDDDYEKLLGSQWSREQIERLAAGEMKYLELIALADTLYETLQFLFGSCSLESTLREDATGCFDAFHRVLTGIALTICKWMLIFLVVLLSVFFWLWVVPLIQYCICRFCFAIGRATYLIVRGFWRFACGTVKLVMWLVVLIAESIDDAYLKREFCDQVVVLLQAGFPPEIVDHIVQPRWPNLGMRWTAAQRFRHILHIEQVMLRQREKRVYFLPDK